MTSSRKRTNGLKWSGIDWFGLAREIKEHANTGKTEIRREWNNRIADKFIKAVTKHVSNEDELISYLVSDFELFCVAFLRMDDGKPMFTAPWQSEATKIVAEHVMSLFIFPRKVGKSAWLTAYSLWRMANESGKRLELYAPTKKQLFIMHDIYKIVKDSDYLRNEWVRPGQEAGCGYLNMEGLMFGKTRTELVSNNLAIMSGGENKRGGKGAYIFVDEIELVPENIRHTVLDDMIADTYTEKKMILVGTPELRANPNLEDEWKSARDDPEIGTMDMDIWRGVMEGAVSRDYVKLRFKRLHIHCPWGRRVGICGKEWKRKGLINNDVWHEGSEDEWHCNKECMLSPVFTAENMGQFVHGVNSFFDSEVIENVGCKQRNGEWEPETWELVCKPEPNKKYIMSIDWGNLLNSSQICVWEVDNSGTMKLRYWEEVKPVKERATAPGPANFGFSRKRAQEIASRFGAQLMKIYADGGNAGYQINFEMTKDNQDGGPPIPPYMFAQNPAAEKKEYLGIVNSGPYKTQTLLHYRNMLIEHKIRIPYDTEVFDLFRQEHLTVKVTQTANDNISIKEPSGGSIDLLDSTIFGSVHFFVENEWNRVSYLAYGINPNQKGWYNTDEKTDLNERGMSFFGIAVTKR